jgi:hypothetical protein
LKPNWSLTKFAIFAVVISALAIAAGFAIDVKAFAGNLLGETAGVLLGALLVVLIVDRAVENDRTARWGLVAEQTQDTLRLVVIRTGMDVYLALPAPRPAKADPYTLGHTGDDMQLSQSLRHLAEIVGTRPNEWSEDELVAKVRGHLQVVRGGVLPQLLAIGTQDLIARLTTLEMALQELENTAWLEHQFGGLGQFGEDLANLVNALADVSEELAHFSSSSA